ALYQILITEAVMNEFYLFLSEITLIPMAWCILVFITVFFVALDNDQNTEKAMINSGLIICIFTAIASCGLNFSKSSFLIHYDELSREIALSIEKLPDNTKEEVEYKNWREKVHQIDSVLDKAKMNVYLSTLYDTVFFSINILGAGVGGSLLGAGILSLRNGNSSKCRSSCNFSDELKNKITLTFESKINKSISDVIKENIKSKWFLAFVFNFVLVLILLFFIYSVLMAR
ncbi:hypothetical protein, partial [Vibrio rotiferianus]|uniref:hypothetical protein n=1 Tax=Vibrio rotiferianus TaxID=190895 RepID=UPI001C315ED7